MRAINVIVEKNKVIKRQKNNSIVKDSERYHLLQHIMIVQFSDTLLCIHVLSELHIIYAYIVSNRCYQIYGITYFRIFFGFYFDFFFIRMNFIHIFII